MSSQAPMQAAIGIAPLAASLAERSERERSLAPELVAELRSSGLMHMCLPRSAGGAEAHPSEVVAALEQLARADGASAWCAMVASTASLLGAYLSAEETETVFGSGRGILGGVFAPRGSAVAGPGGYTVDGRWSFVSGIGHSDWVLGGCIVRGEDGPVMLDGARPDIRLMIMPVASLEVIDTWEVAGLCGTGSHDAEARGVEVPAGRSVSLFSEAPHEQGPLYAFPLFGMLALGIAAVSLGIARGAIEELIELAAGKRPAPGARTLAERATVQAEVARAEAALRAARAFVDDEIERSWGAASSGTIDAERRLGLRLAATHATQTAAAVASDMYRAGGGTAIYASSPLQRRFRDANVATQHMMVAPATWELTGRILLGQQTDMSQL